MGIIKCIILNIYLLLLLLLLFLQWVLGKFYKGLEKSYDEQKHAGLQYILSSIANTKS